MGLIDDYLKNIEPLKRNELQRIRALAHGDRPRRRGNYLVQNADPEI